MRFQLICLSILFQLIFSTDRPAPKRHPQPNVDIGSVHHNIVHHRTNDSVGRPVHHRPKPAGDTGINYEKLRLNKTIVDSIPCFPPPPCPKSQLLHGSPIPKNAIMVDVNRKILMEFSPKAGCTAAVTMFLNHMGFVQNEIYSVWPHLFREEYFYKRCGFANPCMYESPDWYRFKVVRNPYDRAVSSYIHVMKHEVLREMLIPAAQKDSLTYEQFLEILHKLPYTKMQGLLGAHVGYQSQPYERKFWKSKNESAAIFHHIVHIEQIEEDLAILNNQTNSHFQQGDKGVHVTTRSNETNHFVGNVSWHLLQDHIPIDYGRFYNQRTKELATNIFIWDISMYKYKFPFKIDL
jgi:hypothetical protein